MSLPTPISQLSTHLGSPWSTPRICSTSEQHQLSKNNKSQLGERDPGLPECSHRAGWQQPGGCQSSSVQLHPQHHCQLREPSHSEKSGILTCKIFTISCKVRGTTQEWVLADLSECICTYSCRYTPKIFLP